MAKPPKEAYDLTDAEKRDLIQLIQQGKALPEKYRCLNLRCAHNSISRLSIGD
jgi:hypothetical protein